jgi:HSP20 family protein
MADQRSNQNDDAQRQSAGATTGSGGASATSTSTSGRTDDRSTSDRERSIATGRDTPRSSNQGVARRPGGTSLYGLGPFSLIRRMTEDMDRLFENLAMGRGLGAGSGLSSTFDRDTWIPQVETFRRGDKLVVRADLPGLKKEDVDVEINDGVLTISGERCDEREDTRDDFYRTERSYGQFYRAIPLPENVNAESCDATFKDGVLEVNVQLPKQQDVKARKVSIR